MVFEEFMAQDFPLNNLEYEAHPSCYLEAVTARQDQRLNGKQQRVAVVRRDLASFPGG